MITSSKIFNEKKLGKNVEIKKRDFLISRCKLLNLVFAFFLVLMIGNIAFCSANNIAEEMTFDIKDNADVVCHIKYQLNAKQYVAWKSQFGNNPALLKRQITNFISQYEITNFKVDENAVERQIDISLLVKGMVRNKGEGVYEFSVPKDWKGGEKIERGFQFHTTKVTGLDSVMDINLKVLLPAQATVSNENIAAENDKVILYRLRNLMYANLSGNIILIISPILLLAGALLIFIGLKKHHTK